MQPNNEQLLSLLRTFLQMVGTFVTTHGLLGVDSGKWWELIAGIILMVAPTVWSMYAHTDSSNLKRVTDMVGVEGVVVNDDASPTIAKIAIDPSVAKVTVKPGDQAAVEAVARGGS